MGFKLGLCSVSFRDLTPAEIMEHMKKAGLSIVEWGSDVHVPPEKAEEIALLQNQYKITCSSYGTYFILGKTPISELGNYIAAAQVLGTNILRLWCGNKNSEDLSKTEKEELFAQCRAAADIAKRNGAVLCMECHNNTYTNTAKSALELMKAVNSPYFKMYWQPSQFRSVEENYESASLLAKYTVNIHAFNWEGSNRYPLREAKVVWEKYLTYFDNNHLLLEFMPDDNIASLAEEAAALKEIVK